MISSGMKRGLAATAISAMAVTGLPFLATSASAAPLSSDAGGADQVVLYSQFASNKVAALPTDGENTSVSLAAGGGSTIAKVNFSYSLDGTNYTPIASGVTRSPQGDFETEWTPDPLLNGATVTLKIEGFTAAAPATAADTVLKPGIQIVGALSGNNTVEVNSSNPIPVFQQPYAAPNNKDLATVSGTTSATTGTVAVSARSGGATGTADAPVTAGAPNTWSTVLDLTGYQFGSFADATANQIVIGAVRDTDDAEANTLRNQDLSTGTVTTTPANPSAPSGGTTTVTVTVKDSTGAPIVGAQVYDTNGNRLIGYTDKNGQVKDTAAAGGNHSYYANSTNNPAYEPGIDPKSDVVVGSYIAVPTTATFTSTDGSAFDDDEYSAGDTYVTVKDQNGNPVSGRTVEYYWDVPGTAPNNRVPASGYSTATTDSAGKAAVVFPTSSPSGDYVLHYRVPADSNGNGAIAEQTSGTLTAGQAVLNETPAAGSDAAGGSIDYTATLLLDDANHTALAGRNVTFTYTRGTEKAPADGTADAGIVDGANIVLTKTVVTDANGATPTVTVKDKAETPAGSELGGKLDAATSNTPNIGNAGASDSSTADFTSANSVGSVVLNDDGPTYPMPGMPAHYTVTVKDDNGLAMPNQTVQVSIDHGFLYETDSNGNPVPVVTNPDMSGDFKHAASQTTITTDSNGVGYISWGLERDAGFDDDGAVVGNLSVVKGSVSDKSQKIFYSGDESGDQVNPVTHQSVGQYLVPLHVSSAKLTLADKQDSSILPDASTNQNVFYDFTVKDQYGNLVKALPSGGWWMGITNTMVDNTNKADFDAGYSQFAGEAPAVVAYDNTNQATTQNITLQQEGSDDSSPVTFTTDAINWYVVDLSASTFTLTHDTADSVPVGTAVTETVTAKDQKGQPIPNLHVDFLRSGPNAQNGDVNAQDDTDSKGIATYNFVGDAAGVAKITAVLSDNGVQVDKLTDSVTFTAPTKDAINATLAGIERGAYDRLVVKAPLSAAGANVKLYRVVNGVRHLVKSGSLNQNGKKVFTVKDTNGSKRTRFVAVVAPTDKTQGDTTNGVWVK